MDNGLSFLSFRPEAQKHRADFTRENPDYVFSEEDLDLWVYQAV